MKCIYGECEHFVNVDDGEDENGNPYPPNPYCEACDEWLNDYPWDSDCPDPSKMKNIE